MKVAELKQVVDANAVEMRQEFANVRTEMRDGFANVHAEFANVRTEMRDGFTRLDQKMDAHYQDLRHQLGIVLEDFVSKVEPLIQREIEKQLVPVEGRLMARVNEAVDVRVNRKLAAFERRLTAKPRKR